jgi:DNA-binding transcriptional LysR family regulator
MKFQLDILKVGLDPILHFESIGRLRSLKSAAHELGLSQPAVTQSLSKLESSLGVKLCVRSRTQFVLTEAGQRLFSLSQEIKKGLVSYQGFLEQKESYDGLLSIGILSQIQNEEFEKAIVKTVKAFPKMKLSIQSYAASEIQSLVSVGELDVGIGIFNQKLGHLSYKSIGEETICHYISEKHPLWSKQGLVEDDLKNHPITWVDILSRNKLALAAEIFVENKKGVRNVMMYTDNLLAAIWILRSGTSIVPMPAEYLESEKRDFKYRHLGTIRKPFTLKQEVVSRRDFANASVATKFFLQQLRQ